MAAIEVRGLERRYSGGVLAVAGIDLEVSEGEIYAFLGPNGAGKTTHGPDAVTLLQPTGGTALVAGHDVCEDAPAVRRSIGVALQEAALDPLMTGRELMLLQATLHGLSSEEGRRKGDALLDRVGLTQAADRLVGTYSGGMRRRLDLATALVHDPSVLFLDEPTTGLDPVSRIAIWDEVRRLNGEGTTVFLTTQYLEEADQLADRVGIIDDGKMAAEGTPDAAEGTGRRPSPRGRDRRGRIGACRGDTRALRRPDAGSRRHPDGRPAPRRRGRGADRSRAGRGRLCGRGARAGAAHP